MRQNLEKPFTDLKSAEPSRGLFDRIIIAINKERERRQTRRLLFGFLVLLLVSLIATPISGAILAEQMESSGVSYFFSAAVGDLDTFFAIWQDFCLAILESLPIASIVIFFFSLAVAIFTLRLFLYRKKLLFGYLKQSFA